MSITDSRASGVESSSATGSANVKSAPVEPDVDVKAEDEAADTEEPGEEDETQTDVPEQARAAVVEKEKTKKTARPSKRRRMENWAAGLTGAGKLRHQ